MSTRPGPKAEQEMSVFSGMTTVPRNDIQYMLCKPTKNLAVLKVQTVTCTCYQYNVSSAIEEVTL